MARGNKSFPRKAQVELDKDDRYGGESNDNNNNLDDDNNDDNDNNDKNKEWCINGFSTPTKGSAYKINRSNNRNRMRNKAPNETSVLIRSNPFTVLNSSDEFDSMRATIQKSIDSIEPIERNGETLARQRYRREVSEGDESSNLEQRVVSETALSNYYSSESSSAEKKKRREKPKIPDGGWGWMVVLASLFISMVADGVSFSFGLLYIEFLHEFGASKSKTSWIGSLFMAVPLMSGPIMSAFVDRYGCRNMTIVGGLISGLGFVLSSFVSTIEIMYLTFGVIAGLGLGLCYVTSVVSVAFWFDKKRTLAVGLGACGTGIGTFIYAPMTTYFIKEYGWRGTCLLLAGTFFNMIISGIIMRDPEWLILEYRKQDRVVAKKSQAAKQESAVKSEKRSSSNDGCFSGTAREKWLENEDRASEHISQNVNHGMETTEAIDDAWEKNASSVVNLPTFLKQNEKVPFQVMESFLYDPQLHATVLENYPSFLLRENLPEKRLQDSMEEISGDDKNGTSTRLKRTTEAKTISVQQTKDSRPSAIHASTKLRKMSRNFEGSKEETNPLLEKQIAHTIIPGREKRISYSCRRHTCGEACQIDFVVRTDSLPWLGRRQLSSSVHYTRDTGPRRNSVVYRGVNSQKCSLTKASSCPDIYRNSMTTLSEEREKRWYGKLADLLKEVLDFSMFLELHFLLLSLSTILLYTWFIVPYFYLAEYLTKNDYTESDVAKLISIIGITNTIGMIALGWAGDQSWMNVVKTYTWCLIASGLATISMFVFARYYVLLIVSSAAFGLFFASNFSFTPVILVELIPLERFTTAYGLILLCQGIGNLLGPPLAGWLFDMTDTWELSFLMAGSWIIFSGILMGVIPYTRNRKIFGNGPVEMERTRDNDFLA